MNAGDQLPEWEMPVSTTLVVSTALATRDFQDVHHDRDLAQSYGAQDIFVNILTSNGLVERYVTDWMRSSSTTVDVRSIAIRLGAPAHPGDTLRFTGSVESVDGDDVTIAVRGAVVSTGSTSGQDHVTGKVVVSR
ncbi:MAG: beta-hydroxyacyl-ACP dehydratase [Actinomycetota bacterium]|nr:beta-hydroxyacyl-ACP dehydratase [Actinomycetota bacterium]